MGKGEIARYKQISPFPTVFSTNWRTLCYFCQILNFGLQALLVRKSLKFVVWEVINKRNFYDSDLDLGDSPGKGYW